MPIFAVSVCAGSARELSRAAAERVEAAEAEEGALLCLRGVVYLPVDALHQNLNVQKAQWRNAGAARRQGLTGRHRHAPIDGSAASNCPDDFKTV